mgnify:CR=1 FL=1
METELSNPEFDIAWATEALRISRRFSESAGLSIYPWYSLGASPNCFLKLLEKCMHGKYSKMNPRNASAVAVGKSPLVLSRRGRVAASSAGSPFSE